MTTLPVYSSKAESTQKSSILNCELYDYLTKNLTPRHFLTDENLIANLNTFYHPNPNKNSNLNEEINSEYYDNPSNLTTAGRAKVLEELNRLEKTYIKSYGPLPKKDSDTEASENKLDVDSFLALYLYTTNLGYKRINSQLRFGHNHGCETVIDLINCGIERLSRFEEHQLNPDEHKLIRYINLPQSVLKKIIFDAAEMDHYFDKAFLSTSFNAGGATAFSAGSNVELIVKTNGSCKGAKIDGISPFPSEGEYLFTPGTKFHCHMPSDNTKESECSIKYNSANKLWTIYVCAINFETVVRSTMTVLKATKRFKSGLKPRSHSTPVTTPVTSPITITSNLEMQSFIDAPIRPASFLSTLSSPVVVGTSFTYPEPPRPSLLPVLAPKPVRKSLVNLCSRHDQSFTLPTVTKKTTIQPSSTCVNNPVFSTVRRQTTLAKSRSSSVGTVKRTIGSLRIKGQGIHLARTLLAYGASLDAQRNSI